MSLIRHSALRAEPARFATKVLVTVIAEDGGPAVATAKDVARWRRLTPLTIWTSLNVRDPTRSAITQAVDKVLSTHAMQPCRLIVFGAGAVGRCALELVLEGVLDCAGMLAVDVPCAPLPFRIADTAAAVRVVVGQVDCGAQHADLLGALRAADIDERIIRLNAAGPYEPQATANAAETFLLELVALASRQAGNGARANDPQR
jgi:hypothetical protein